MSSDVYRARSVFRRPRLVFYTFPLFIVPPLYIMQGIERHAWSKASLSNACFALPLGPYDPCDANNHNKYHVMQTTTISIMMLMIIACPATNFIFYCTLPPPSRIDLAQLSKVARNTLMSCWNVLAKCAVGRALASLC